MVRFPAMRGPDLASLLAHLRGLAPTRRRVLRAGGALVVSASVAWSSLACKKKKRDAPSDDEDQPAADKRQDSEARKTAPDAESPVDPSQAKVLAPAEWRAIEAVTARILPSGSGLPAPATPTAPPRPGAKPEPGPGAREAGVVRYIDRQLATPELAPIAQLIVLAARVFDNWAREQHGVVFADLTADQQDAIVEAFAHGRIPTRSFPQREVFAALHNLTLEGFLGDPRHGGNIDQIGWRAIGFPEPHLRTPPGGAHSH